MSVLYSLNSENNTATVIGSRNPPANWELVIRDSITFSSIVFTVTSIGKDAFSGVTNLGSVIIPDSVITIGNSAFYQCTKLTSATIGSNVTTLGDSCFRASGLTSIVIPNSVTSIGGIAFGDCTSLTSINLGAGVQTLGNSCFLNAPFTSIFFQSPNTLQTFGNTIFNPNLNPLTVTYYFAPNGIDDLNSEMVSLKNTYFPANTTTFIYLATCFNEGTKILSLENDNEKWINVEDLTLNTLVKTYLHGYKRVKRIGKLSFINNPDQHSFCIYKMSKDKDPYLIEDLYLTGEHSIMVDKLIPADKINQKKVGFNETIDDKQLAIAFICHKFEKMINSDLYNVYNFALESETGDQRFGVYANGILCETPSINSIDKKETQFPVFLKD
jgi:hypothetical protein